jgi:pimeloyl-ACP methyl ester carboxylesterase
MRKWLFRIVILLALLIGVGLLLFRTPDSDAAAMQAKYGGAQAHYVETDQARIHYRDVGPRDASVLLLVHGSNSSLQTWEQTVDALKGQYRLISLDLPGHGITGPNKSRDYSAKAMIGAATAVLDDAKVEKAVWVGNSMGGWVAWRAALDVPARVSGLVLVDASGAVAEPPVKLYLGARLTQSWLGRQLLPILTPRSVVQSSLEQNYADPKRLSEALVTRYWDLARYPGNRQATADRAIADRETAKWNDIGKLSAPTLIIWGKQDRTIPWQHGKAFERAIAGSKMHVIADAGHLPMEEAPKQFVGLLQPWLASQTGPSACGRIRRAAPGP